MRNLGLVLMLLWVAASAGAQVIGVQDVEADFNKADYKAVVSKTSRLFSSTQDPTLADKYKLLMLRGESQLQLKDRLGAVATFKTAARVASDLPQYAAARANLLVADRSSMGRFTPRSGTSREALDILPIESRKQAMLALKADLSSQNKSQIDAALRAETLPTIEKAFVPLSDMFCLETEATGRADETGELMRDLGQRAYRLMTAELNRQSRRVNELDQLANSVTEYSGWTVTRRGLHTPERNELADNSAYLNKLRDRAVEYHGIASKLGGNEQRWDALVREITEVLAATDSLINNP